VEAHGTNHNILSHYCRITAKQTPVTTFTTGFQENVIPILWESPATFYRLMGYIGLTGYQAKDYRANG